MVSRREWLGLAIAGVAFTRPGELLAHVARSRPIVRVRKNPGCGCCDAWVDHMKEHGFDVTVVEDPKLYEYKQSLGVPREAVSCHTGIVEGYVVEGHVPADLVQRMLRDKPKITGIGVGGMPMGSPGMEGPRKDAYDVLAFTKGGKVAVYARR